MNIAGYHAHIYFEPETKPVAERIRAQIASLFPDAKLGRMHDVPVGPHAKAMYQVAFGPEMFASLVPWLMLNRDGLTVFLHPETGDDLVDHRDRAMWMGQPLPLDLNVLT